MHNILFFGNSLTAGYGLRNPHIDSFPARIEQKINALHLGYKVVNAGLSGDTSEGGLNRITYWMSQPVDVFVIELGINDIIRRIAPQTTQRNLQAIIDKVKAKYPHVKMALMGIQLPGSIPSPFASQFNAIYPTLANANQMALAPFFLEGVAGKVHLNLLDGLHPNAEGYKVIADNVWPVIENLLTNNPER